MADDQRPIILWFRRDLRLTDHPALHEAALSGRPVIPVFLNDEGVEALGAAPRMRIGMSVAALAETLVAAESRLVLKRGKAVEALRALVAETGAGAVWWTAMHDPLSRGRDAEVAEWLEAAGLAWRSFPGQLLHDPSRLLTKSGGPFKVYTPFWKALRATDPGEPLPPPVRLRAPEVWPVSDALEDWHLEAPMNRGGPIVAAWQAPGEAGAKARLDRFAAERIEGYAIARDYPGQDGSSRLSENLTYGEISPRTCWALGQSGLERGAAGAEQFLKEMVWRDFSHHLLWHTPTMATDHWKSSFGTFPWDADEGNALATAWKRGQTGIRIVDAAMREMYVTGRMHNRARMIVASLLTKHMLTDWRVGLRWFEDCLTDWDPASNAVNWQWVAGSGPDASPFFRIYNPDTQSKTWDAAGDYVRAWIAEGEADPPATALAWFDAVPLSWGLEASDPYPKPVLDLAVGREAALAAFRGRATEAGEPPLTVSDEGVA